MSKIYYIYHIPHYVYFDDSIGKIGVTSQKLKIRIKANKKKSLKPFSKWEILEEHTDIYKVSDREIELQKEYGYKVDVIPYWKTIQMRCKKGWIKAANTNTESGHLARISKLGGRKGGKIAGKIVGRKNVESGHMDKIRILGNNATRKSILQYDKDGNFIKEWVSAAEVSRNLNIWSTTIAKVCKGKLKSTGGFVWKYKDEKKSKKLSK